MLHRVTLLALTAVLVVIAACAGQPAPSAEDLKLKVGLLPIPESLPMWVAERDGYFTAESVSVELVNFASAVERDGALQANQLDGQLNDPVSTGLLNKERTLVKVVRFAYKAQPGRAMISIVVGPNSKARTLADLKGSGGGVALSQNTVIEYVVDRLVKAQGLDPAQVTKTEVSKIPLRLEMLSQGQVAAAGLPEPFTTLARQQGGRTLADDGESGIGSSTIVFRTDTFGKKSEALRRFLRAYERAVLDINANPQKFRALLVDKGKVPEAVKDVFAVPLLPVASVPRETDLQPVFEWMTAKGLLGRKLTAAEVVDGSLLPN